MAYLVGEAPVLVPIGFRSFHSEGLACRPDFCAACGGERVSVQVRGFQWLSVLAIPLIPLGRHSRWLCHTCGRPPQAIIRLPAAILALAGFGVAAYATAMMSTGDSAGEDIYHVWEGRLLFGAFALLMGMLTVKYLRVPSRRERLRHLQPASLETCLLCGGALDHATPSRCRECDVARGEVEA